MRKRCYIIILLLCFSSCDKLFSQNKVKKDSIQFFNSIEGGINYSFHGDSKKALYNFGLNFSADHVFRKNKTFNVLAGIGLIMLRNFQKKNYTEIPSHITDPTHYEDIKNRTLMLRIPVSWRVNIGRKTRFFISQGISMSINILDYNKGLKVYKGQKTDYEKLNYLNLVTGGPFVGCGVRIPLKSKELVITNTWNWNFIGGGYNVKIYLFSSINIGIQF
jgi:hypothetical protein